MSWSDLVSIRPNKEVFEGFYSMFSPMANTEQTFCKGDPDPNALDFECKVKEEFAHSSMTGLRGKQTVDGITCESIKIPLFHIISEA